MPQWPEIETVRRRPDVIAGETDMLPPERSDVFDHLRRRGDGLPVEFGESRFEIERIPVDDGVDQKGEREKGGVRTFR